MPAALLSCLSLSAGAATVQLQPDSAEVLGSFDIDLHLNAVDTGGNHPGQYSGRVVIEYDPALVSFTGFTFASPVSELYAIEQINNGSYETVSLGFENALDDSLIGSYSFSALPGAVGTVNFTIYDYDDVFGSFVNESPANLGFEPEFLGADVTVVPVPAAIWLMGSALAGMAWAGRSQKGML
jgi:hypothetical protein